MAQKHTVLLDPYLNWSEISPMLFLPATKDVSFSAIGAYVRLYLVLLVHGYERYEPLTAEDLAQLQMEAAVVELLRDNLIILNDDGTYTLKPIPGLG